MWLQRKEDLDRFGTFGLVLILIWQQMASKISPSGSRKQRRCGWLRQISALLAL
jgi:hypothetical protein